MSNKSLKVTGVNHHFRHGANNTIVLVPETNKILKNSLEVQFVNRISSIFF